MFCFCSRCEDDLRPMQVPERKTLLLGRSMSGKSTFVHNMFYNKKKRGNPRCTLGVDVTSIDLHGEGGKIRANIWDCAGNPKYAGLGSGYWAGATHAIIFGSNDNDYHKWYFNALPKTVKKSVILDYDQDCEDFKERKEWLYDQIFD